MLNQMKIVTRLWLGFGLLLACAVGLGGLGARSMVQLSQLTSDIFRHPFTVTRAIMEVRAEVLTAQKIMTSLVHYADPADVDRYHGQLLAQVAKVDGNLAIVRERFLGSTADVDHIDQALVAWRAGRDETIRLVRAGRRSEAIAMNDGRDARLGDAVLKEVNDVVEFAGSKAASFRQTAEHDSAAAVQGILIALGLALVGCTAVALSVTVSVRRSLKQACVAVQALAEGGGEKVGAAEAIGAGDLGREIRVSEPLKLDLHRLPDDELGELMHAAVQLSEVQRSLDVAFQKMTSSLRQGRDSALAVDWLKTRQNELNFLMRGERDSAEMAAAVLGYLVEAVHGGVGALYLHDERAAELCLAATYACGGRRQPAARLRLGEGLIGQAAQAQKTIRLDQLPADFLPIASALGEMAPRAVWALPLRHGERLVGALEIGAFHELSDSELEFLDVAREGIAIAFAASLSRQRLTELLEQTQQQTEELRVQQEELQQSNEELEERAQLLEQQREQIRIKNREIETASEELREKAAELERVSAYKSQFLANMSHELRTPLNSLMILSSLLAQNKDGNLSDKQVEFAATIHGAGKDLLELISDILDLSKVEAGQLQFDIAETPVAAIADSVRSMFVPMAEQKGLDFEVDIDAEVPATIRCDEQRTQQILKNLLSNALKFTDKGRVALHVGVPVAADNPLAVPAIAFVVSDTGIGIPAAKQDMVFQAFQQADGSISRKYGGTGLGLSISLQLARKMGGDIRMRSEEGKGSVFTLYLPVAAALAHADTAAVPAPAPSALRREATPTARPADEPPFPYPPLVADDRDRLTAGDRSILIIEDDATFAKILVEVVRQRGFAALSAGDGESGVALADRYLPSAIILDVMLPHIDGWGVMRSLKDNPRTRHLPVHFLTCLEDRQRAMAMGAVGFASKPIDPRQLDEVFTTIDGSLAKGVKKLLIVEDNADEARSLVALLAEKDVDISVAASGEAALDQLTAQNFDCMVLDLGLADMSGFDLLEHIQRMESARRIPVIIHSGRELTHDDERQLRRYAESIIIKGAKSPERLLNEVTLFLHLVESNLHPNKQRMIRTAIDKEAMLEGRKVLLVDDDMRNIFSLSSVLAERRMTVIEAENGREALARLDEHPDIGIVLMDIMMPEMDGYTAMREIRRNPRHAELPIIAMTAKALKGDQEKCMAAGASDYISKPIEVDKLLSLIRVWIFQQV